MKTIQQPGSWPSPLSASLLAQAGSSIMWSQSVGHDLWWDEVRPSEGGRTLVVSREHGDILKAPWSAKSQVHEYGGISWLGFIQNGLPMLAFVNKADQRIYITEPLGEPIPFSPEPPVGQSHRYIDMIAVGKEIWCIREVHAEARVQRDLVAVGPSGLRSLESSSHFYAHPRLSADGRYLSWVAWKHPQMPWDGTEVRENQLYFISDASGWWNLWQADLTGQLSHLIQDTSEWGFPLWQLGMRALSVLDDGQILSVHGPVDARKVVRVNPQTGQMQDLLCDLTDFKPSLSASSHMAYAVGSSASVVSQLIEIDLHSWQVASVVTSIHAPIDTACFPKPHEIKAVRKDGREVFAILHAAHHPLYEPSEKPPLMVVVHGGPTANSTATLSMKYAYFTTRGISVVDVNYGGSTGYGREYRNLLRGQWGVVDCEDVLAVVDSLIAQGVCAHNKVLIRGGSAGGFTVLNALVSSKQFAAGASYYGVADCTTLATDTHDFESRYLDTMIGAYPAEKALYIERSPLTHLSQLSSPLVIFQGLEDKVVPPSQSEAVRDACVANGLKHAYVAYEGEGHGFRQARTIVSSLETELSFYGEVLGFVPQL
ncbi:MAG: prolyl oligopeptidase family serine peptidase [Burkholderiales bacterium]|nr:prolyl oligopeptidase family serine peptidase [Burkholderiales bacterium]